MSGKSASVTVSGQPPETFGSPIDSEQADAISTETEGSFDWIGDDRRENESDFEAAFFEEIEREHLLHIPPASASSSQYWIPRRFVHVLLLIVVILCVGIMASRLLFGIVIVVGDVPLHLWALLLLMAIFLPIWIHNGIVRLTSRLGTTATLSKTDLPSKLDSIKTPLSFLLTGILLTTAWLLFFPKSCPPSTLNFFDITEMTEETCYLDYAPRLLFFLIFSGVLFTLNSLLMTSLRSSFQEKSFKSRLIRNRFGIHVINQLLNVARETRISRRPGYRSTLLQREAGAPSEIKAAADFMYNLPFLIGNQIAKICRCPWSRRQESPSYHPVHQPTASLDVADQNPDSIEEEFSQFRREILRTIRMSGYETVASAPPRSDHEAKIMAKRIFRYLCPSRRKYLTMQDFSEIINSQVACRDAFELFDADRDGSVTRSEFRGTIVKIFREQRNLAQSFANTGTVLSILDNLSASFISLGLFLLLLGLLGVRLQSMLGIIISLVLGLNFIVFDAANKTFHSLVFLFVVHPFDVGDQIIFSHDDASKQDNVLTVLHIHIQHTVFRRWNGLLVSIPNHVLAANPITNLSRVTEQWEKFEISLALPENGDTVDLQAERMVIFRKQLESFLASYPNDYYKSFELKAIISAEGARAETDLNYWKFSLKIRCKETLDNQKKWIRHSRVLVFIQQSARSSGISIKQKD